MFFSLSSMWGLVVYNCFEPSTMPVVVFFLLLSFYLPAELVQKFYMICKNDRKSRPPRDAISPFFDTSPTTRGRVFPVHLHMLHQKAAVSIPPFFIIDYQRAPFFSIHLPPRLNFFASPILQFFICYKSLKYPVLCFPLHDCVPVFYLYVWSLKCGKKSPWLKNIKYLYVEKVINYIIGPFQPRARRFYTLPKILKEPPQWRVPFQTPPGRPIFSACDNKTYRTAE